MTDRDVVPKRRPGRPAGQFASPWARYHSRTVIASTTYGGVPCLEWSGALTTGYGVFSVGGKLTLVHRWIYEQLVGPIPAKYQVDHLCRNRACVNPAHLEAVTQTENLRRAGAFNFAPDFQRAKTHCPAGHPYDEANTYSTPASPGRQCRACRGEKQRQRRRRAA